MHPHWPRPTPCLPRYTRTGFLLLSGLVHLVLLACSSAMQQTPSQPASPSLQLHLRPAGMANASPPENRAQAVQSPRRQPSTTALRPPLQGKPLLQNKAVAVTNPTALVPNPTPAKNSSSTEVATATANGMSPAAPSPSSSPGDNQAALYRSTYLHNPEPPYPERSRELGEQGRVQLRVRVSPQGRALQVDLVSSSHSRRLDEAARQAVAAWRFQPARQDGVAIESSLLVPITFSLPPP